MHYKRNLKDALLQAPDHEADDESDYESDTDDDEVERLIGLGRAIDDLSGASLDEYLKRHLFSTASLKFSVD